MESHHYCGALSSGCPFVHQVASVDFPEADEPHQISQRLTSRIAVCQTAMTCDRHVQKNAK